MQSQNKKRQPKFGDAWKNNKSNPKEMDDLFRKFVHEGNPVVEEKVEVKEQPAPPSISDHKKDQPDQIDLIRDQNSQDIMSRLDNSEPAATTMSGLDNKSRQDIMSDLPQNQVKVSMDIMSGLDIVSGHLQLPNTVLDSLPARLSTSEQLVFIHLYRLSWGFGKSECLISFDRLGSRTGMTGRNAQRVTGALEEKGLITKLGNNLGCGKAQGVVFRVVNMSSQDIMSRQDVMSDNKRKDLKNNIKSFLLKTIKELRQINTGRPYPIGELADDCKRRCAQNGIAFDHTIFNELVG